MGFTRDCLGLLGNVSNISLSLRFEAPSIHNGPALVLLTSCSDDFRCSSVSSLRRSPEGKQDFSTLTARTPAEESSVAGLILLFPTPASDTQTLSRFDRKKC